ncbi:MAG: alpha/beta hydrolase [Lacipirellulaceae bacterium]
MRLVALLVVMLLASQSLRATEPLAVPLWDGVAPGSAGIADAERLERRGKPGKSDDWLSGVVKPTLAIHLPGDGVPRTGVACVILPGGGYAGQAIDKEGHAIARWMAERGVVAGVATYRCGQAAFRHPVPLNDAQRAIRTLRSKAAELGFDANRVGVLGFSAGGHLAATSATRFDGDDAAAKDPVERESSRPAFAVLVYPVITLVGEAAHGGSAANLLGPSADRTTLESLSADRRVTKEAPPIALFHAADDNGVPVENSLLFYDACRKHGVPAELHLYPKGGHGFGMISGPDWAPALGAYLESK